MDPYNQSNGSNPYDPYNGYDPYNPSNWYDPYNPGAAKDLNYLSQIPYRIYCLKFGKNRLEINYTMETIITAKDPID